MDNQELSAKILATPTRKKRITAADRAAKLLEMLRRFARQVLPEDQPEFESMLAKAEASTGNSSKAHQEVSAMFDQLGNMRLAWQRQRLHKLGASWLYAKRIVAGTGADVEFIELFDARIDAYVKMPDSTRDERKAKLDLGFKLMDALRAPLGRCPGCIAKGKKFANELTANERTSQVFELCAECHREKRASLPVPAPQLAPTQWAVDTNDELATEEEPKRAPSKRGRHGPKGEKGREAAAKKRRKTAKPIAEDGKGGKRQAKHGKEGRRSRREDVEGDE